MALYLPPVEAFIADGITEAEFKSSFASLHAVVAFLYAGQAAPSNALTLSSIGTAGQQGFGVGIAPALPAGFSTLPGTTDSASENYGNYLYSDGSVMVYVPAFVYKYGTGSNGLSVNVVDVKSFNFYADLAAANAAGYALHRAFYNAGSIRPGFFVDKYKCSNNAGIASSIKNRNPLSSDASNSPFSALTGSHSNIYAGAITAAKTRGSRFFCNTRFIQSALALLANAHASASTSNTFCAWYSASGVSAPRGSNNQYLGDVNDSTVLYAAGGGGGVFAKTGSANFPAKVAHNGQLSGVMDLNGNMSEINLGLTSNGSSYYLLKNSADVSAITSGTTLATDAWGAVGLAAMYDDIGATYESLDATTSTKFFGSSNQVLSNAVSGTAWAAAGAGIPLLGGVGGTNQFGEDSLSCARVSESCALSGGEFALSRTGVWSLNLGGTRSNTFSGTGFRSATYL
jgi:hypothetical protein